MSEWIKEIVSYLLLVSIVMHMLPGKNYEPYIKLFAGFLLILFVFRPILKIGSADAYLEQKISEFITQQEYLESQIAVSGEIFCRESEEILEEKQQEIAVDEIESVQVEVMIDQ